MSITAPTAGSTFCVEQTDEVCFEIAVADDAGTPVSPLSLDGIDWFGPAGFTSTMAEPCVDIDGVAYDGEYTVTVTFNNGSTATATYELSVVNTFEMTCPDDEFIFPDLTTADCELSYSFPGFTVDAVNCVGTSYTYCINMLDSDGAVSYTHLTLPTKA